MRRFSILLVLMLCGCATTPTVIDTKSGKRLELKNPFASFLEPAALFSHPEMVSSFETEAARACPNGYQVKNKQYIKQTDSMVWDIECHNL